MSASEKKGIVQFIQFILVGVLNTLVDLVVTRLLQVGFGLLTNQLLLTYYIPKVIGYACGIVNSYVLNTAWTFQKERKRDAREIISFLIINALTLGVSLGLMFLFRNVFGLSNWWNNVISIDWILRIIPGDFFCTLLSSGIALVLNFLGNKLIVFAKRKA
ncbi:MAG: GtrA family protein [Clostridia bacterium]|jgi:putative flippase GtrA|nr:GtrA family protein [Clostridia bacterium]